MNKNFLRIIGIQIILLGLVLSVFEFLIDNSELVIGCVIFVVYVYFLLKIIRKQHKIQRKENMSSYDSNDLDGMGNQGRFPNKKPKNRAV